MKTTDEPILAEDPVLRETLKRCSPATYRAACQFRATGDRASLHTLISGVIERFVDRDLRDKLAVPAEAAPALRLREDLGLDSLTMMEVVMIAEEVLCITISYEELARLRNLGEVHDFIAGKLEQAEPGGATAPRGTGEAVAVPAEEAQPPAGQVSVAG